MFFSCWLGVGKKSIFWLWRWSDGLLKAYEVLNLHCKIFYNVVCYFYGIRWMSLCISSFYSCFHDSKALKVQHIYSLGEYEFYLDRYFGISIVLKHVLKYRSMQVVSWNKTMTVHWNKNMLCSRRDSKACSRRERFDFSFLPFWAFLRRVFIVCSTQWEVGKVGKAWSGFPHLW